jgi:outer membrane protein TolC
MTCHARLAILLWLLTVTACSVRGTNIEPVAPAASLAFDAAADAALASTLPVDAWWTTFRDARVTTLVERALSRSPDVRQARALVRLARAVLREQEGTNWPEGRARAGYEHSRSQVGATFVSDVDLFDAGVDASWEVDIFGYRLGVLVGSEPQALAADLRVPEAVPPPPDVLAIGEPISLLRRRPDVAGAEYAVLAAAARAGVSAADLFPRLVLSGGVGVQSFDAGPVTNRGLQFGLGSASRCRFSSGTAFVSGSSRQTRLPKAPLRTTSERRSLRSRKLSVPSRAMCGSGNASAIWSSRPGRRARRPISPGSASGLALTIS